MATPPSKIKKSSENEIIVKDSKTIINENILAINFCSLSFVWVLKYLLYISLVIIDDPVDMSKAPVDCIAAKAQIAKKLKNQGAVFSILLIR